MTEQQPWMCYHANEVPAQCKCDKDCYCKENTCKKDRRRAIEFNLIDNLQEQIKVLADKLYIVQKENELYLTNIKEDLDFESKYGPRHMSICSGSRYAEIGGIGCCCVPKNIKQKIKDLELEIEEYATLTRKHSDILTKVVNAIKGKPPELTWWSHHDAGELAEELKKNRDCWRNLSTTTGLNSNSVCLLCGQPGEAEHCIY